MAVVATEQISAFPSGQTENRKRTMIQIIQKATEVGVNMDRV